MIYDLQSMKELDRQSIILACSNSYLYYHKSLYYQPIYDKMMEHTKGKWEKAVRWFVSNSARAINQKGIGFTISLDQSYYTKNKLDIGYRGVKQFLDWANEKSYIHIYRGYVDEWKVENGKRIPLKTVASRVILRPRALEMWKDLGIEVPNLFREMDVNKFCVLRDRQTKEEIEGLFLEEDKIFMTKYNDSLYDSNITFRGKEICVPQYTRTYTGSFDITGRLYAAGGGVQLMPQNIRAKHLKIDGESVVELDYSSMHPNICYQLLYNQGVEPVLEILGENFNPYDADLSFIDINAEKKKEIERLTKKSHNPIRNLAKLAILIGMNSVDKASALGALSSKIGEDRKKNIKDQLFYAIDTKIAVGQVFDAIQKHNELIADVFFTDRGVVLQKYDSDVMISVIDTMIQKGHSILCYHDSALVKKSAEFDLYEAMVQGWRDVFGDTTFCKVERK